MSTCEHEWFQCNRHALKRVLHQLCASFGAQARVSYLHISTTKGICLRVVRERSE